MGILLFLILLDHESCFISYHYYSLVMNVSQLSFSKFLAACSHAFGSAGVEEEEEENEQRGGGGGGKGA